MPNVGIGTNCPQQNLDIRGDIKLDRMLFKPGLFEKFMLWFIRWYFNKKGYYFEVSKGYKNPGRNNPSAPLVIYGNGNVGIGT